MLVVADSSPLNILVRIELSNVLPVLFDRVAIPGAVRDELTDQRTPLSVRSFFESPPVWLQVVEPFTVERILSLDHGEEAAIALALELSADALLIDERDGRREAAARGLSVIGTLGVLELAAQRGLIGIQGAIQALRGSDYRIDARLVDELSRRWGST